MFSFFIYLIIALIINFFIKKKKYLQSYSGSSHQVLTNSSVPLTGGILFIVPFFWIFYESFSFFYVIFFILFIIGFLSDTNTLTSPKKRFLLQLTLILFFIFMKKLEVFPTRIDFIDKYFENTYASYFFTAFCLMILINGSNFIDGLNGLLLGYFLIILFILYQGNLIDDLGLTDSNEKNLLILFLFIFFLNLLNQLFLGDSGAYSISFFIGFILIYIYNLTNQITPYFIILLLWYPCFENLFSIIRKIFTKKNPLEPDNEHLHQYLFIFFKNKFKLKNIFSNIFSSLLINLYNLTVFFWASKNLNITIFQINLIIFNVLVYLGLYIILKKLILKK